MNAGLNQTILLQGKSQADYLDAKGKERSSMFFRRGRKLEYVKAGALFRRERKDQVVETARVLSVTSDSFGIPHVRYELKMEKLFMAYSEIHEPRILALDTFAEMYHDRI